MGMDISGRNPQNEVGEYFRANLWSWRPIQMLIEEVNSKFNLQMDTSNYGYNSGAGLTTQEDCDRLADTLEFTLEKHKLLEEDDDTLYVNLGMWTSEHQFSVPGDVEEELNRHYPIGSILYSSVIASNGQLVKPAWGTTKSHIEDFIKFLRNCGGFEIW